MDGAGKIAVGTGSVAGDQGCGARHEPPGVEVVEQAEWGKSGASELEDHESSAGTEDTGELAQGLRGVGDVADSEGDGDDVEGGVWEGEFLGVAFDVAEFGGVFVAESGLTLPSPDEHFGGEVKADDLGGGRAGEQFGQVAGAAGGVEDMLAGPDIGPPCGDASPGLVASEGVEAVVEVVGGRDGGEHALDADGLVVPGVWVGEVFSAPRGIIVGERRPVPGVGRWGSVWVHESGGCYVGTGPVSEGGRMRHVRWLAWGLCVAGMLLGAWGCSYNPATGKKQFTLISRSDEIDLGNSAAPGFREEMGGLVPDAAVQSYVTELTRRLVAHTEGDYAGLPWEVSVVNSPDINAFAIPGGKVFVTRGLIEKMTNEAQLAGVLGHEIGHVTGRHTAEQLSTGLLIQGGAVAAAVLVEQSDDESTRRVGRVAVPALAIGGQLVMLKFSRDDELEADRLGVRYMSRAGYDPRGLRQVMEMFDRMSGSDRPPAFLSTHPDPRARIRQIDHLLRGEYAHTQGDPRFALHEERFRENVLSRLNALPPAPPSRARAATDLHDPETWCALCAK